MKRKKSHSQSAMCHFIYYYCVSAPFDGWKRHTHHHPSQSGSWFAEVALSNQSPLIKNPQNGHAAQSTTCGQPVMAPCIFVVLCRLRIAFFRSLSLSPLFPAFERAARPKCRDFAFAAVLLGRCKLAQEHMTIWWCEDANSAFVHRCRRLLFVCFFHHHTPHSQLFWLGIGSCQSGYKKTLSFPWLYFVIYTSKTPCITQ